MGRPTEKRTLRVRGFDARSALFAALLAVGCTTTGTTSGNGAPVAPPKVATSPVADPRETVRAFVSAADTRDFDAAYRLLSGSWRARYTPARFAADFGQVEGAARDKLARAVVAASREPVVAGNTAEFPIGADKCVRLVKEEDGWKILALE